MEPVKRADVAREAGVSESTVSRALNDSPSISQAVQKKVKETAKRLGYIPNRQAVMLATRKTHRLGLIIPSFSTFGPFTRSYFPRLLDGVLLRAEERGYTITVLLDKKEGKEKDLSQLIHSKEVDGLLFSVTPVGDPRFVELKKKNIPFVLINNLIQGMECINGDPRGGMEEAFQLMKQKGFKHVGYITGDEAYYDSKIRYELFSELINKYEMESHVFKGDFSKTCGYRSGEFFFKKDRIPDCIMTASDRSALGLLHYCREKKITVPEDISLIGYDDLGPARDSYPALTTIHNPVKEMGMAAVDRLIETLEGSSKSNRLIRTSLIIRDSVC